MSEDGNEGRREADIEQPLVDKDGHLKISRSAGGSNGRE